MREELSPEVRDILVEIGNIGGGNAATALSQITGKRIEVKVPKVSLVPVNKAEEGFRGMSPNDIAVGAFLEIYGDLKGCALLIYTQEAAKAIVKDMLGEASSGPGFTEMESSAFKELSNILTGTYLNALTDFLGNCKTIPSIPRMSVDMVGAMINYIASNQARHTDKILVTVTEIRFDHNKQKGFFILILDPPSMRFVLNRIDEKLQSLRV